MVNPGLLDSTPRGYLEAVSPRETKYLDWDSILSRYPVSFKERSLSTGIMPISLKIWRDPRSAAVASTDGLDC